MSDCKSEVAQVITVMQPTLTRYLDPMQYSMLRSPSPKYRNRVHRHRLVSTNANTTSTTETRVTLDEAREGSSGYATVTSSPVLNLTAIQPTSFSSPKPKALKSQRQAAVDRKGKAKEKDDSVVSDLERSESSIFTSVSSFSGDSGMSASLSSFSSITESEKSTVSTLPADADYEKLRRLDDLLGRLRVVVRRDLDNRSSLSHSRSGSRSRARTSSTATQSDKVALDALVDALGRMQVSSNGKLEDNEGSESALRNENQQLRRRVRALTKQLDGFKMRNVQASNDLVVLHRADNTRLQAQLSAEKAARSRAEARIRELEKILQEKTDADADADSECSDFLDTTCASISTLCTIDDHQFRDSLNDLDSRITQMQTALFNI